LGAGALTQSKSIRLSLSECPRPRAAAAQPDARLGRWIECDARKTSPENYLDKMSQKNAMKKQKTNETILVK